MTTTATAPAIDPRTQIAAALKLLAEGNPTAAANELNDLVGKLTQEQAAAAGATQPKPPRKANVILGDVLQGITALLGNSPALVSLVEEILPVISEL